MKTGTPVNRLVLSQMLKVSEWLKSIQEKAPTMTIAEACEMASKDLGFTVTKGNISGVAKALEIPFKHMHSRGNGKIYTGNGSAVRVVARELTKLFEELGRDISPNLYAVSKGHKMTKEK